MIDMLSSQPQKHIVEVTPEEFGIYLRQARISKGHLQRDVSRWFGYTDSTVIGDWESGNKQPPPKNLKLLSEVYAVDIEMLKRLLIAVKVYNARQLIVSKIKECEGA